jgi:hypothetical protein
MLHGISDKSSGDLVLLYHKINKELTAHLLNGDSWTEQEERITTLTEISKELTRRKVEIYPEDEIGGSGEKKLA